MSGPRFGLTKMTKAEAVQQLQERGEWVDPAWSAVEVKSRLKELLMENHQDQRPAVKNIHKAKISELRERCTALDISFTENHTRPQLMRKLRDAVWYITKPSGGDLMRFGKYAEWTYEEVMAHDKKYNDWVIELADTRMDDTECSPQLLRYRAWLKMNEGGKAKVEREELVPPRRWSGGKGTSTGKASSSGGQAPTAATLRRPREEPKSDTEDEDRTTFIKMMGP